MFFSPRDDRCFSIGFFATVILWSQLPGGGGPAGPLLPAVTRRPGLGLGGRLSGIWRTSRKEGWAVCAGGGSRLFTDVVPTVFFCSSLSSCSFELTELLVGDEDVREWETFLLLDESEGWAGLLGFAC